MSHAYSVLIHDWINQKKARLEQEMAAGADAAYCQGQLDELMALRQYLTEHIDLDTQTYYH